MSTFPPLTKGFSWTPSTSGVGADGNPMPLPTDETYTSATIGIRADDDTAHSVGNYATLVLVPGAATSESVAALTAALQRGLPVGNYWAAIAQTDTLNGVTATSAWTSEVPFSISPIIVQPAPPTGFSAA
jgi:hypothetical protein